VLPFLSIFTFLLLHTMTVTMTHTDIGSIVVITTPSLTPTVHVLVRCVTDINY